MVPITTHSNMILFAIPILILALWASLPNEPDMDGDAGSAELPQYGPIPQTFPMDDEAGSSEVPPSGANPHTFPKGIPVILNRDATWREEMIGKLWEERDRMGFTPLVPLQLPSVWKAKIVLKNESAAVTKSLKHRYAWALFMWALVEGHITKGTTIYEASSGNTAFSEAYLANLIGCPFTAVVPDTMEGPKEAKIRSAGADVVRVPIGDRLKKAAELAASSNGFFMNQFANADRAEEIHIGGSSKLLSVNVFYEINDQLRKKGEEVPNYFVHSAGTGGTISSVGRFVRKHALPTRVILADTEFSVYADYVESYKFANESGASQWVTPGMAGTGYGPMGPVKHGVTSSMDRNVIDGIVKVPDLASTAAMRVLQDYGVEGGTSTGLNFLATLSIAAKNNTKATRIATLLADNSSPYLSTYYNRSWIAEAFARHGGIKSYDCWIGVIQDAIKHGFNPIAEGIQLC